MSAPLVQTVDLAALADATEPAGAPDDAAAPHPVEVRRNPLVSGLLGAAAAAIATAYLWRAVGSGTALDWSLCLLMALVAAVLLHGLLDARTPLLVADESGVRVRLGAQWRSVPWEAVDKVTVQPRRGLLSDGRLVVRLFHIERAIEGLDARARHHARLNRTVYGAALAVPLGLTTRVNGGHDDLATAVRALSSGRADVVTLVDEPRGDRAAAPASSAPAAPSVLAAASAPAAVPAVPAATRGASAPEQAAATGTGPSAETGSSAGTGPVAVPEQGRGSNVRALARLGDAVPALVIGDFEPEPAYDPVIGPELAAARTRVGLSIEELAERTRIRPHVIESIEVDDFAPCGGDFYARGHLRTLARVLGKDAEPMVAHFDARYADAPVNARQVFEAELATGLTGSMRSTVGGGPNWTLLIGVALLLVMLWSALRLFAGDAPERLEAPPSLNGSAGLSNAYEQPRPPTGAAPLATELTAVDGGSHLEVRDGAGALAFEGDLAIGQSRVVRAIPPVTVSADNAGAVQVVVGGRDLGRLGARDQPATKVFRRQPGSVTD